MHQESHRDTPQGSEFTGGTIIDSSLEAGAERDRLRHEAYQKAQELLQAALDKFNASVKKPRSERDTVIFKATSADMVESFKILLALKEGHGTDDDVRKVLIGEREKAKGLIESEETKMEQEFDERLKGLGEGKTTSELLSDEMAWKNSPAKLALTAEIAELNRLIASLEASN